MPSYRNCSRAGGSRSVLRFRAAGTSADWVCVDGRVDALEFKATSVSLHTLDRQARRLKRIRTWHILSQPDVEDYAEYRLLLPEEVQRMLEAGGFEVLAMYDNREFRSTELTGRITHEADVSGLWGRKLYVFARKQ